MRNFKNNFNLKNKLAIITGGAGLLGKYHASALAELGCNIILFDKICSKNTAAQLQKKYKIKCQSLIGDITKEKSVKSLLKKILKIHKSVDILINNAAINPTQNTIKKKSSNLRLENFSLKSWNDEIAVGLTGAFICSKIFGHHMSINRGGVIINISSDLGLISPNQELYKIKGLKESLQPVKPVTYSVVKHGIIGLTKYLATYWPKKNVRSNSLCAGGVKIDQSDDFVEKVSALIPMNRMADPDEYKSAIQFLCSDASKYMNGSNLVIDGGRSSW